MARSPAHAWGQIVGDVIEEALRPRLATIADEHGLYLDQQGSRLARPGKKVTWKDAAGNAHDLDYVMERGGSPEALGVPVAFVEVAWRRYTKHSRNKAQEIQGAVLPLADRFRDIKPFLGAVVAGVFTEGALQQLRSVGFTLLYLPYADVVEAFASVGLDASYDEDTPDSVMAAKLAAWKGLGTPAGGVVGEALFHRRGQDVEAFQRELQLTLTRSVIFVRVLPLYGHPREFRKLEEAWEYVAAASPDPTPSAFVRWEILIEYSNGDRVEGNFNEGSDAVQFLHAALV